MLLWKLIAKIVKKKVPWWNIYKKRNVRYRITDTFHSTIPNCKWSKNTKQVVVATKVFFFINLREEALLPFTKTN